MDCHELCTRHHIQKQVLAKWKDRPKEASTWENTSTLWKRFPNFVFEDKNSLKRGEQCHDKGQTSTQLETIPMYVRARPTSREQGPALEHGLDGV